MLNNSVIVNQIINNNNQTTEKMENIDGSSGLLALNFLRNEWPIILKNHLMDLVEISKKISSGDKK